ncbi:MAG: beta-lactamase family protein [Phaeodactylibacter sp.]|nr:beta-lactamase family protein [Phaeodactylibacter sp.]MCB9299831.1 beta-lactamase family protein [Lewinellaceae bacterium]
MEHVRWRLAIFLLTLSSLVVAVADPFNTPPIFLAPTEDNAQAFTERDFTLNIEVEDIDNDVVEVNAFNLPEWLTFDPVLRQLHGRPERIDKGEYFFAIKADDGRVVRTKMISLKVDYGHSVEQHLDEAFSSLCSSKVQGLLGASAAIITPDGQLKTATFGRANAWNAAEADPNYRYRVASVSKLFTSALVMRLVEEGYFKLDDTLYNYLPVNVPFSKEITIRQLLSHTAGVVDHLNHPAFYRGNWKYRTWTEQDINRFAAQRGARFKPGKGYGYSNTGFYLLGELVEAVLKKPLGEAYKEYIFEPLGLKQTIYDDFSTRKNHIDSLAENARAYEYHLSAVGAAGSIVSTPSDVARFGHALYSGQLVSEASLQEMEQDIGASVGGDHYGLGMRLWDDHGIQHMGHTGSLMGYRSILMYLPEYQLTIAISANESVRNWNDVVNGLLMEMADYYR